MYLPPVSANAQRVSVPNEQPLAKPTGDSLPFPVDKPLPVILGASFNRQDVSFHSMRYDFMPGSIDENKPGSLLVDKDNVHVEIPTATKEAVFAGPKKPATKECVLIYDKVEKVFYLERLATVITLKQIRDSKRKAAAAVNQQVPPQPPSTSSAAVPDSVLSTAFAFQSAAASKEAEAAPPRAFSSVAAASSSTPAQQQAAALLKKRRIEDSDDEDAAGLASSFFAGKSSSQPVPAPSPSKPTAKRQLLQVYDHLQLSESGSDSD